MGSTAASCTLRVVDELVVYAVNDSLMMKRKQKSNARNSERTNFIDETKRKSNANTSERTN